MLATFLCTIAALGGVQETKSGIREELAQYYQSAKMPAAWDVALKQLASKSADERRKAAKHLVDLMDQSYQDEKSGKAPWHATPYWGGPMENPARNLRSVIVASLDKAPAESEILPVIAWLLGNEPQMRLQETVAGFLGKIDGKEAELYRKTLGAGGMGEVYLAEHVLLRRPCALKLIQPHRAVDPRNLLRFEREVRAMATLTHPNTVQIFDYGFTEAGTFYYVMEYLPGLTLEQLVQQHGPVPPERAIYFLRQVCWALREAHAIGLIHRDIKPGNILVCERGGQHDVAKLLDFGLVLVQSTRPDEPSLTGEHAVAGSPHYMSPEQAAGRDDVDHRADIYGLGAVAYFLLTGRPLFVGRTVGQVLAAHQYELPEPLTTCRPELPAKLEALVLRCLSKAPAKRFPDALAMERALADCPTAQAWGEEEAAAWWRSR